jgi:hypothetical protein
LADPAARAVKIGRKRPTIANGAGNSGSTIQRHANANCAINFAAIWNSAVANAACRRTTPPEADKTAHPRV